MKLSSLCRAFCFEANTSRKHLVRPVLAHRCETATHTCIPQPILSCTFLLLILWDFLHRQSCYLWIGTVWFLLFQSVCLLFLLFPLLGHWQLNRTSKRFLPYSWFYWGGAGTPSWFCSASWWAGCPRELASDFSSCRFQPVWNIKRSGCA